MSGSNSVRAILFCTYGYFPYAAGGAEHQARLQAEELVTRGYTVHVVCPRWPGTKSGPIHGVQIRRLRFLNRRPFKRLSYLSNLLLFLVLRGRRFDLFGVHLAELQADVAVLAGKVLRRPVWVKVAAGGKVGEIARMRSIARGTRYLGIKRATRVQAISDQIAEEVLTLGVPAERLVRIPNGVKTAYYAQRDTAARSSRQRLNLPVGDLVVLFVGRLARHKGIEDLLVAWERASLKKATLVVLGSRETAGPVGELKAQPSVVLRAWTDGVQDYYAAADVFVLPSLGEGMSNAMLEAMAAGLPVISTRVGAATELIEDGRSGLLVDPGDRDQLVAALQRMAADQPLRDALGAAAASRVRERYSIVAVVDQLEAAYKTLGNRL